jgi:hypothetical protein
LAQLDDPLRQAAARQAGMRGSGALTTRGIGRIAQEAGVDPSVARQFVEEAAGFQGPIRSTVGIGNTQALNNRLIPSSVTEGILDLKGEVKRLSGRSGLGRRTTDRLIARDAAEREMRRQILEGSGDAATKALQLTRLASAKGATRVLVEEAANELGSIPGARNMSKADRRALTYALDTGQLDQLDLAPDVADWFARQRQRMVDAGVQLGEIKNYVPRRLTHRAQQAAIKGEQPIRDLINFDVAKAERFQKLRTNADETLEAANERFRREHGYDFDVFETDFNILSDAYLAEMDNALMKAAVTEPTGAGGVRVLTDANRVIDETKAGKAVDRLAAEEEAFKTQKKLTRAQQKTLREDSFQALQESRKAVSKAKGALTKAKNSLSNAERAAKKAVRSEEAARLALEAADPNDRKLIERLTAKLELRTQDRIIAEGKLQGAQSRISRATADFHAADAATKELAGRRLSDEAKELALKGGPKEDVDAIVRQSSNMLAQATRARKKFIQAPASDLSANNPMYWLAVDPKGLSARADNVMTEMNKFRPETPADKGRLTALKREMASSKDELAALKPGEGVKRQLIGLRMSEITADFDALKTGVEKAALQQWKDMGGVIHNPKFMEYMKIQFDVGFKQMRDEAGNVIPDRQMAAWYDEALNALSPAFNKEQAGEFWAGVAKAQRGYNRALQWWKGMATGTPGFLVRNVYSGMFNMYLDGVGATDVARYRQFHRLFEDHGLDEAVSRWTVKHGADEAARMSEALQVAAGTGWGQTFNIGMKGDANRLLSPQNIRGEGWNAQAINPVSHKNVLTANVRSVSEHAEAVMRGAHALHGLKQGDTFDEALARVTKYHFNYRDVGELDKAIRQVSPFFVFFSRNLGLQAQMFAQKPFKLNRSLFNTKRNFEWADEGREDSPDWLGGLFGGIPLGLGGSGSGEMFFTPDLPTLQTLEDLSDPARALRGQVGPFPGAAYQALSGKSLFHGGEFSDRFTTGSEYDDNLAPRLAPVYGQIPVIQQLLDVLPGTKVVNGQMVITDRSQTVLEQLAPMLGQWGRFGPETRSTEGAPRKDVEQVLGWAGLPFKWNSPDLQQSVANQEAYKAYAADKAAEEEERLRAMLGG